jgi:RNA recognition motif-containing protein
MSNLLVRGLPLFVQDGDLKAIFGPLGTVVSSKVMLDVGTGESKGYAFVAYAQKQEADSAIQAYHGKALPFVCPENGQIIFKTLQVSPSRTTVAVVRSSVIYIRNLPKHLAGAEQLHAFMSQFGFVLDIVTRRTGHKREACHMATVEFDTIEAADAAIQATHNKHLGGFEGDNNNSGSSQVGVPTLSKFADATELQRRQQKGRSVVVSNEDDLAVILKNHMSTHPMMGRTNDSGDETPSTPAGESGDEALVTLHHGDTDGAVAQMLALGGSSSSDDGHTGAHHTRTISFMTASSTAARSLMTLGSSGTGQRWCHNPYSLRGVVWE